MVHARVGLEGNGEDRRLVGRAAGRDVGMAGYFLS
jgi:hypothetical protein